MQTDTLWWARQRTSVARAYAEEDSGAVAARLGELLSAVRGDPPDEVVPRDVVAFLDAAHLLAESGNLARSLRAWRLALYALH
jgi:hypothetical protein